MNACIHERGNGFPSVGDHVPGDDGELYEVLELVGPIHTGSPGQANYVYARVQLADWRDVEESDVAEALATLEDPEELDR